MSLAELKAPFPWFGGKRRVAAEVWAALGDVDNYVEPFAGSIAVLLGRPSLHKARAETVNDADAYLANFWRAVQVDPDGVAHYADWPVNETDLFARHAWLVNSGADRLRQMEADPDWFDVKVAGWWVWGICAWIGSGWCSGAGPHRPHLGTAGQGVNRQLPHLGNSGQGVNRQLPHLGTAAYMRQLADRLRDVRVCQGDWTRVVTTGALTHGTTKGVFLDPPYLGEVRAANLYTVDDHTIAHDVRKWAIDNGNDSAMRIVLAGYVTEHEEHMPDTWRLHRYSASRAYGTSTAAGTGAGNDSNRHLEALWFSPHCVAPAQDTLFEVAV